MPLPSVVERPGSLSIAGMGKETTFGTAVARTNFAPVKGLAVNSEPGLFYPPAMTGVRDLNIFPVYGQRSHKGNISGPFFPTNGIMALVGAVGRDGQVGYGVTGTSAGVLTTTLSVTANANDTTVTLTSVTGLVSGSSYIQIGVNAGGATAECRKVTNIVGSVVTLDTALVYGHASGAAVTAVVAPYTHSIIRTNTLDSYTLEKNIGGYQSEIFAGARIGKYSLKMGAVNTEAEFTADMSAQNVAVSNSPTTPTVVNESAFAFSEATLSLFGVDVYQAQAVDVSIDNGLKETWALSGEQDPAFITPVTSKISGTYNVVFSSLNDANYGYFKKAIQDEVNGALDLTIAHTGGAGSININIPLQRINKYSDDIKMTDIVMVPMSFEGEYSLSTSTLFTVTIVNNVWTAY
jgi:hypothetical protein